MADCIGAKPYHACQFTFNEDNGIEISSDKTILVKADGNIAAQSSKVELKAKDKLYIVGGMNLAQRVAASIPMIGGGAGR